MFKLNKKLNLFVLLVLAISIIVSGCSKGNTDGKPEVKEEITGKADKNTLVVATMADARSIDPHGAGDSTSVNALLPIVETLVSYDADGKIQPLLAESWEEIDSQTWKFNLRKGVKFHNGEEMKASDVVYSFKRATSPLGSRVQYIMIIPKK